MFNDYLKNCPFAGKRWSKAFRFGLKVFLEFRQKR